MYKTLMVGVTGMLLGAGVMYYLAPEQSVPGDPVRNTWSPKPFSQSAKKYAAGGVAGGIAYALALSSPFLTEDARVAITQDYQGAPNDGNQKHTVAAELVDCSVVEGASPSCTVRYSETDTRFIGGEEAQVLWDALVLSGYFTQESHGSEIVLKDIVCIVEDRLAQSSPGNMLQGFGCSFD